MIVRVEYGSQLKDMIGVAREDITLPLGATVSVLTQHIATARGHQLEALLLHEGKLRSSILVCVQDEQAAESVVLKEGDRVLFFPLIAGG